MESVRPEGVCSRQIVYDVEDGIVKEVRFIGGCSGNHQAISNLVKGHRVEEVITMLKGIKCKGNTSCPDQLAKALEHDLQR